jgi:diadenosine tetraphosphate (Ap4A) HIT family hydrolase
MVCPFCSVRAEEILLTGEQCLFISTGDAVLIGSGMIVPRAHRETVFDLAEAEWAETFVLLRRARALLDERYHPDGYNVGWNSGAVGGQEVFHAHLHVIPRFRDEPLAGYGIRHALKQTTNRRPASRTEPQPAVPEVTTTYAYDPVAAPEGRPVLRGSPCGDADA